MYVYDKAHELAKALKESPEYKTYHEARQKIKDNQQAIKMLDDLKKMQVELQMTQMSGGQLDPQKMSQFQSLYQIITLNPDAMQYLQAEVNFDKLFSDIYKILAEAVEINIDFMK